MALFGKALTRKLGPLGVALTAYDIWRRLPEKQREQLLAHGVKHGSRVARYVIDEGSAQVKKRLR